MNSEIVALLKEKLKEDPLYRYLTNTECPDEVLFNKEVVAQITPDMLYSYTDIGRVLELDTQKVRNTINRNDLSDYITSVSFGDSKRPKFDYINVFKLWMHTLLGREYDLPPQTIATIAGLGVVQLNGRVPKYQNKSSVDLTAKLNEMQEEIATMKEGFIKGLNRAEKISNIYSKKIQLESNIQVESVKLENYSFELNELENIIEQKEIYLKELTEKMAQLENSKKKGLLKAFFKKEEETKVYIELLNSTKSVTQYEIERFKERKKHIQTLVESVNKSLATARATLEENNEKLGLTTDEDKKQSLESQNTNKILEREKKIIIEG